MTTRKLVSFRTFLQTGTLGPITPDISLFDVAKALGVPTYFSTANTATVPTYWGYNNLEFQFEFDPPHKIDFFQIENAGYLKGEYEVFTENLIMTLDGFDGQTKPSEFLAAGLWDLDAVRIKIGALSDDVYLSVCAGLIEIVVRIDTAFIEDADAVRYLECTDIARVVNDIDGRTFLDSIYAFPAPEASPDKMVSGQRYRLFGREYLKFLGCPETPAT